MSSIKKTKLFAFFVILIFIIIGSCTSNKAMRSTDEDLKIRINQFYVYFQDENYEKWLEFSPEKLVMNKKDAVKYLKEQYRFKVISYKIDSISRSDELNAKVKMTMKYKYLQDNKEFITEHVDCWTYKNGNWYVNDFGRVGNWECK